MNKKSVKTLTAFPVFLAFLCMGFGDVVGPMVSLAKETFQLSTFVAQLLPLMGFIMFGLLSIPMGVFQDRVGKKFILSLGLFIAFIGLIIPVFNGMYGVNFVFDSSSNTKFLVILFSIFLLGAGATLLQVSGNPIMRDVSPEGKYSSNLSFGQTIKAIGSSMGFLIPAFVAKPLGLNWTVLFPIYACLILATFIWLKATKIKEQKETNFKTASFSSCISLLANPNVMFMVIAIFLYVGAEVSMSSGVPLLLSANYGLNLQELGLVISWGLFFFPIFIGRLLGGVILRFIEPNKFLIFTVTLSIVGIIMMYFSSQLFVFIGIVLVGLGFANIFPLIFSITVEKLPSRANEISGLMVTAIVGGAIIPPIFGFVADKYEILTAFLVPLICAGYIFIIAATNLSNIKQKSN